MPESRSRSRSRRPRRRPQRGGRARGRLRDPTSRARRDGGHGPGRTLVHGAAPGNVATRIARRVGDPDAAFADAAAVVGATFETARQKHAQLEPTGCLARVGEDGRITVWTPHQAPHRARYTPARLFDLPANRLRVVVPTVGVRSARTTPSRPSPMRSPRASSPTGRCSLLYSRTEDFVGTESRHATPTTLAMALVTTASSSRCAARRGRGRLPLPQSGQRAILSHLVASYRIEHWDLEGIAVFTDTPVSGRSAAMVGHRPRFLSSTSSTSAVRGRDRPVDARLRMRRRPGDPWGYRGSRSTVTDIAWSSSTVPRPSTGWPSDRVRDFVGRRRRGVGMASTIWKSGIVGKGLDHSAASIRLEPDGSLLPPLRQRGPASGRRQPDLRGHARPAGDVGRRVGERHGRDAL